MSARKEDEQEQPEAFREVILQADSNPIIGAPIEEVEVRNVRGETVFSIDYYDTLEEGKYFIAAWPTATSQDDFFSHVETLSTSLEAKGVSGKGVEHTYNWEIDTVEEMYYREPWRRITESFQFIKATVPGVATGCIRLETPYGEFHHFTYMDADGITQRAGIKSSVDSPTLLTQFARKSLTEPVPEQMLQKLFSKRPSSKKK